MCLTKYRWLSALVLACDCSLLAVRLLQGCNTLLLGPEPLQLSQAPAFELCIPIQPKLLWQ